METSSTWFSRKIL